MRYRAINYFPTANRETINKLAEYIYKMDFEIAYVGKTQHPKKWDGNVEELAIAINDKVDIVNFTLLIDKSDTHSIQIDLVDERQSDFSMITFSSPSEKWATSSCLGVSNILDTFAVVTNGTGSTKWEFEYKSSNCPTLIEDLVLGR